MFRPIALLLLAALTGAPALAHADDDAFPLTASAVEAERALESFARCVAETRTPLAREVLEQSLGSPAQGALIKAGMPNGSDYCLGSSSVKLVFRPIPFAGGLASYFVTTRYVRYDLPAFVRAGTLPVVQGSPERCGLCLVQHDAAGALALIRTRLGGPEEDSAIAALQPALAACVTAGVTLHLDKLAIRSVAAVVLYRYAAAAEAGAEPK